MAYANARAPKGRLPVIAAVAAIHVGLGYALVIGLAASGIPEVITQFTGINIPVEPPKPPPPPKVEPVDAAPLAPRTAPQPRVDLNRSMPDMVAIDPMILPPLRPAIGDGEGLLPIPSPSVAPGFAPKAATPRGTMSNWVTANDYPASELRLEHEGRTRIALTVSSEGRVESCAVTGSSGFISLDRVACARVTARARFNPATDDTGAKVAGRYATTIRWEIPD